MTWSDNGRATFEYDEEIVEDEPHVIRRSISTHAIFTEP
jgi:hypothetical protein